jgi:anhydro-N-acetylmuramic acid kinase
MSLYIGVMSGTSLDGVDVALCEIDNSTCSFISSFEYPFDKNLKQEILNIINSSTTLEQIGTLDNKLGHLFADAILFFIKKEKIDPKSITAIGLHGQTLWHQPNTNNPFSMQLGDANIVVAKTGIKVVADFRRMDMANGGQGAPFAPAFHQEIFKHIDKNVAVLNIGGMANITILGKELKGWDTGVGNVLMDYWISECKGLTYDRDGEFAKKGNIHKELLKSFLSDDYFIKEPPKSTGREHFNKLWLENHLQQFPHAKMQDVQRTLLELTVQTISNDVLKTDTNLLIVCGGGAKNSFLIRLLRNLCKIDVKISDDLGINNAFMEAMAFAWLAYKRINNEKVDLKSVTGAKTNNILGGIYG